MYHKGSKSQSWSACLIRRNSELKSVGNFTKYYRLELALELLPITSIIRFNVRFREIQ